MYVYIYIYIYTPVYMYVYTQGPVASSWTTSFRRS